MSKIDQVTVQLTELVNEYNAGVDSAWNEILAVLKVIKIFEVTSRIELSANTILRITLDQNGVERDIK